MRREIANLEAVQGLKRVPRLVGKYGLEGFLYEYVPGKPLSEKPAIPDDFFDRLGEVVKAVHGREMAYVDLNKRGNILLGDDGGPWLIDFQISVRLGTRWPVLGWLAGRMLEWLQAEDRYHLLKHKRRLRPDLMTEEELAASRRVSRLIALHRRCTRPLTRLRRWVLGRLYERGWLAEGSQGDYRSAETDPSRWARR